MAFVDKRLAKVCETGENIFRNFTNDHYFVVGDKISYQIGDYGKEKYKYRVTGFVLAHGYSKKNEPMYLIGQINMVMYNSESDTYTSDKRTSPRWFTAKELHAENYETDKYFPKIIGWRCNQTITRVLENRGIHLINVTKSINYGKTSKTSYTPHFNVPVTSLKYFQAKRYTEEKVEKIDDVVTAYYAPDQAAAKVAFESGDKDYVAVEKIPEKWDEKEGTYIAKKPQISYFIMVDLSKK